MTAQAAPVGAAPRPQTRRLDVRTAGTITIAGSALGIAFAAAILLTPPMVPSTRFSYPFDATWFVVAQLLFAVQHLAMLAGVLGLAALAAPATRGAAVGAGSGRSRLRAVGRL